MAKPPMTSSTLRIPPHDLEAEQAVLGADRERREIEDDRQGP